MPAWLKKVLQFSIPLLLGVLILWLVFRGQDMDSIKSTLAAARYEWIIASGVAALVAHLLRALRWSMLMEPLGEKPSLFLSFNAVMVGYLANLALPRMGEITRCGAVARKTKLPVNGLFGTVIIERAVDLVLLVVITLLTVLFNLKLLGQPLLNMTERLANFKLLGLALWIYPLVLLPACVLALYFYRKKLSHRLQHPFFIKLKGFVRGLWAGIKSVKSLRQPALFALYSVGIWVCYYFMTYFCVFAFSSTEMLNSNEGLLILVAGSFGFVAPVQGGIGAYHAVISKLLTVLPGRDISMADALSFATLTHAAQTLLIIIVGFTAFVLLFTIKKKHDLPRQHSS